MNDAPEEYIDKAISNEAAVVANAQASTRNGILNRSAFKLGTIPGAQLDTVVGALLPAAQDNGYLAEHGENATRKVIESGFQNGQRKQRKVPRLNRAERRCMAYESKRAVNTTLSPTALPPLPNVDPAKPTLPHRTQPDNDGKPRFLMVGNEGPPRGDAEKRRHVFVRESEPVRIKVMLKNGGAVNWYRVRDADGTLGWQARKPDGFTPVPYLGGADPFDREVIADEIYWPEGEKDVDTLNRLGLLATTFGGTGDGLPEGCATYFAGRNVVVLADNDAGGRQHAEKKAALVAPVAASVRVVHFGELSEKGDVSDWIALGKDRGDLERRVDETPSWKPARVVESPPIAGLDVVCMADVKPASIEWLWPNWVAIGKVSVLAGEGGRGKSTILCDLAARTTASDRWPDGAAASPAGGVIILAAEDDLGDTLAPRLRAAGADMARVFVIRSVRDEKQKRRGFNLQADLERLEAEIGKRDNIRLIIIDPVSSYLGPVDSHKNADVRAVLEPLGEMAARMRVAIICNNHFSKGGGSANSRVIGSVAFVNQARAAFIVTPDEEDRTRMLLIPSKMNIAPIRHGLAFRIEGCFIHSERSEISTSRIMYESTPVTISADQALAALSGNGENKSDKSEAVEFLKEVLKAGPVAAKDVKKEASGAGISPKSLRSARETLRIKPEKAGFESGWVWKLPKVPSEAEDARENQRAPSRV
jgi:putative DNA primase/helicase